MLLWNAFLGAEPTLRNVVALGFAAFVPGMIYQHAVFPMSVTAFSVLLWLLCLDRERWVYAGMAGAMAAASYPTGVLLAPISVVWLLAFKRNRPLDARLARAAVVGGLTALGLVLVLIYAQASTGSWNAYFRIQSQAQHGLHFPLANLYDQATPVNAGPGGIQRVIAAQAWLVTALMIALLVDIWRRRQSALPLDWLIVLFSVGFWLGPLTQDMLSYYRGDAVLVPLALVLRRFPPLLGLMFTGCAALVGVVMGLAFFQGVLT